MFFFFLLAPPHRLPLLIQKESRAELATCRAMLQTFSHHPNPPHHPTLLPSLPPSFHITFTSGADSESEREKGDLSHFSEHVKTNAAIKRRDANVTGGQEEEVEEEGGGGGKGGGGGVSPVYRIGPFAGNGQKKVKC